MLLTPFAAYMVSITPENHTIGLGEKADDCQKCQLWQESKAEDARSDHPLNGREPIAGLNGGQPTQSAALIKVTAVQRRRFLATITNY
jgi:hypothetical protein